MALATEIQKQVFEVLSRASNISFVTADQEAGSVTRLTPGQRVTAEVLSTLPDNRVQVQVGTERFNLDLPMSVRLGQTLEMTFVSADPRSTFAIARQAGVAPPVTLSDASRLLSLLVTNEQIVDPKFRASLQNIGDMLRRSPEESGVLANLLDEALTYRNLGEVGKSPLGTSKGSLQGQASQSGAESGQTTSRLTPEQLKLATFENNAAQILRTIAQNSRFTLVEAVNHPVVSMPFIPGEELEAAVVGTLPGGRVFVSIAGTPVEMVLPKGVQSGDILRLTYISSEPKLTFALPRLSSESNSGVLSEAGRWLSVLEHSGGGVSNQQMYVLDRLNTVLKSLPPNSPAFTAILDEAITYQTVMRGQNSSEQSPAMQAALLSTAGQTPAPVTSGNGVVLSDDMGKLLQAVIKGNRLALLEVINQQAMPTGFAPGQQLRGEVLAALGGGRFMVQVAGKNLEFMMPKGIARGDLINLFFIAEEPQQTFLMARFGRPGDSFVSETGRWLSGFIGEASSHTPAQATLGILRTLLAEPATDASLLGKILQQGLRESGLFYESHLARWFGGDYPLEDILKEPQGRLSPRLAHSATEPVSLPADELIKAGIRSGTDEIMEAFIQKVASSKGYDGVTDQRAVPMVGEQLSALQSGQLIFRGDLFTGQRLEWSVAERESERNPSGGRERSWETSVSFSMPNLGQVTSLLTFDGERIGIKIHAEKGDSVPLLEAGRARLIEQLEGAGLKAAEMTIGHAVA